MVSILGLDVNTASFAMYTFSISVFLQAIVVITFSGAADHGQYRKTLLLSFAFVGAITTMLFLPLTSKVYMLAALCAIVANVCCASSFVLLNSFLPVVVRWHPKVRYQALASREGRLEVSEQVRIIFLGTLYPFMRRPRSRGVMCKSRTPRWTYTSRYFRLA